MKKYFDFLKRTYVIPALIFTGIVSFSCESIVEGLNENPNNPTDASAPLLLTGLQLANIGFQEGHTARIAGIWSGYLTGIDRQYNTLQYYVASGSLFSISWEEVFYGVFQQEKLLEDRAAPVNNRWLIGIARVIKAHAGGVAAAVWGDIPYSQTSDREKYPNPVFDPQKQVYDSVQVLLDKAIADLESGAGTNPGVADIHFAGNAQKWIQVAHTLKARYYLDTKNYAKAYSEAKLGINSVSNSLLAPHAAAAGSQNLYSYGRSTTDITSESAYITSLLDPGNTLYRGNSKTNETARFNYYFTYQTSATGEKSKFIPNTLNTATLKGIFGQTASFPLVTYQENLLILAEAGYRVDGFETGLANLNIYRAFLNAGGYLDATYKQEGTYKYDPYESADFAANGLLNKSNSTADEALLREILLERYLTFFGQKLGFNDLRRTRKEAAGVKLPPNIGSVLPERFVYAQSETTTNSNAPSPIPDAFVVTPVNK